MDQITAFFGNLIEGTHPFVLYLAGINVLTFVLFAIDYAIVCRRNSQDTGLMNGGFMALFAAAGGAAGMLLALILFTRFHMNKHNIAWWFSAIFCLLIWAPIVLVWSGAITVQLDLTGAFNMPVLAGLGIYLIAANLITLAAFCYDKRMAILHSSRVPESVLLGLSLAGGSLGGMLGMRIARHKTRKWYFTFGLPAFVVLHVALFVLAHGMGIL